MINLLVEGSGILGREDAVAQRKKLDLDRHDFSTEPVRIIFTRKVGGISELFALNFLWATVYRTYDQKIPFHSNNIQSFKANGVDMVTPIGPYTFHPENGITTAFKSIRHRIGGAICALYANWEYTNNHGKDLLTPLLKNTIE